MADPNYVWMRSWPSGSVHAVIRTTLNSSWESPATRCGICWPGKRWTDDYPPACRTCETCERRVGVIRLPVRSGQP
jgi:hypothetical protein